MEYRSDLQPSKESQVECITRVLSNPEQFDGGIEEISPPRC